MSIAQNWITRFSILKIGNHGKNYPPIHPNDRCTTVAEFDDKVTEELQRRAREENGKGILVSQDLSYDEWKKENNINTDMQDNIDLKNIDKYDKITNNNELNKTFKETLMEVYERNRKELGLNMTPLDELRNTKISPFDADFGNMDSKLAIEWAKQFEALSNEYYTTCTKVTQTKIYDGSLYRPDVINRTDLNYYVSNSEILINDNLTSYDDFMKRLSNMISSGHAVEIDIKDYKRYIATHEFAHTLSYVNQEKYKSFVGADIEKSKEFNNYIKDLYKDYKNELNTLSEEARKLDIKFVMDTNNYTEKDNTKRKDIAEKLKNVTISRYANKNEEEFMAEAFTDYKYGTNKSNYSIKVGNLIDKYYGRKK